MGGRKRLRKPPTHATFAVPQTISTRSGEFEHEGHGRARRTPEVAGSCPSRGRAAEHDSDSRQRADQGGPLQARLQGDRPRSRDDRDDCRRGRARAARPRCRRTCSTRSCASCRRAPRSCSRPPATAPCWRSAPAARASPCRPCRRATFPISPPARWPTRSSCAPADLKRLIDKTQFAISTEETRYYLNGIYLHTAGTAKARRCARSRPTAIAWRKSSCRCRRAPNGMPGIIVPRKTVGEVQRLIEDNAGRGHGRAVAGQDPLHASATWC